MLVGLGRGLAGIDREEGGNGIGPGPGRDWPGSVCWWVMRLGKVGDGPLRVGGGEGFGGLDGGAGVRMRVKVFRDSTCRCKTMCDDVRDCRVGTVCLGVQMYSNCWSALCYHVAPPSRRALHNALATMRRQLRELVYRFCAL